MKEEYKELKELQKRYLTRLSDLYPDNRGGIDGDHQSSGDFESAERKYEHFLTDVHGEYEAFLMF